MRKNTIYKVVIVFSAIFIIVPLCSSVLVLTMFELRDTNNTQVLNGTVEKIVVPISDSGNAFIYTKEHDNYWTIDSSVYKYIDSKKFEKLSNGDEISFCIASEDYDNYNDSIYTNLVSLESSDGEILSIECYNKGMKRSFIYYLCICLFVLVVSVVGLTLGIRNYKNTCPRYRGAEITDDFLQEVKRINSERRYRSFVILSLVLLLILGAILRSTLIGVFVSEDDTVEVTGTISKVKITESTYGDVVELHTEEHTNYWHINSERYDAKIIESVSVLEEGQHIKMRILDSSSAEVNESVFVSIVSLETDEATLISPEDYTSSMLENSISSIVFLSVGCLSCVIVLIINLWRYMKMRRYKQQTVSM